MKLYMLRCPNCNGMLDMNVDDNRKHIFCSYCGQKIYVEDEKYTINKNINIKKDINENIYNTKRTINDAEVIKAKSEAKATKWGMIFISVYFVLFIGGIAIWFISDGIKERQAEREGKVAVGYSSDFEGENYEAVVKKLKALGFDNIETVDLDDAGWFKNKADTIESISIGGDSSFSSNDYFDVSDKVIINYH